MTPHTPWSTLTPVSLTQGPLGSAERCDVVVVGSGISGALVAFHLAHAGFDVVIIEKRALAGGSTAFSTALVQYELDVPLVDLIRRIGLADARAAYQAMRSALDDLQALVLSNDLRCELSQRPTLYLARAAEDVSNLRREQIARAEVGIETTVLDAEALRSDYGIRRPGALRSPVSFELDPRALTTQLLDAAVAMGARIYDGTSLATRSSDGPLRTTDGYEISAHHVVYATGYATPDWFPEVRSLCRLRSTYTFVTRPVPPDLLWPERALLWEIGSPYLYARTTADHRIIVGGEDDDMIDVARRNAALPAKVKSLRQQFTAATGVSSFEVDNAWAATFAVTEDGLPYIGSPRGHSGCSFNLGFGGNGIVFSLIGAQIIRDSLEGRMNPSARLYAFDRASAGIA